MFSIWEKNSFINFDIIIIGSGILGLSTAVSIKENDPDKEVLILSAAHCLQAQAQRMRGSHVSGVLRRSLRIAEDLERAQQPGLWRKDGKAQVC